jgi:TonB family protein
VTDGARLDGYFSDGVLNGDGTTVWPGGSRYQGQYVNQHFQGNGKLSWPDGDFYEGEFSGGAFHGRGKLTYADGTTFEGHFEKGQIVGEVTARMADGTRLSGVLVPPRRDADTLAAEPPPFPTAMLRLEQEAVVDIRFTVGKDGSVSDLTAIQVSGIAAIDKAANDEIARWHFQPATLNGAPIVYKLNQTFRVSRSIRPWSHGGRYEGDVLNGELSGQGKVTWPGGDTYIGQFAHGHENGHGVYTTVDGRIYEGHFAGGMLSGHAIIRNPDGTRLEGDVVPPHVAAGDTLPDTEYPTTAVRRNKQGIVTIRYRVGVDGTVRGAHVLYFSGTQELDDEAVAQVFRSHLTPATLNGKPIELDAIRVVKFVLQ